jgi:hypothetical protein
MVENCANRKSCNVCPNSSDCEHQVEPDLNACVLGINRDSVCVNGWALVVAELADIRICTFKL